MATSSKTFWGRPWPLLGCCYLNTPKITGQTVTPVHLHQVGSDILYHQLVLVLSKLQPTVKLFEACMKIQNER